MHMGISLFSSLIILIGQSNQLTTTHYVSINEIIHVYFSHMTYLMSHVTSLNNTCGNTCGWFYKLPHSGL
jgi:hypothetical protein